MTKQSNGWKLKTLTTIIIMLIGSILYWTHFLKLPEVEAKMYRESEIRASKDVEIIAKMIERDEKMMEHSTELSRNQATIAANLKSQGQVQQRLVERVYK